MLLQYFAIPDSRDVPKRREVSAADNVNKL